MTEEVSDGVRRGDCCGTCWEEVCAGSLYAMGARGCEGVVEEEVESFW